MSTHRSPKCTGDPSRVMGRVAVCPTFTQDVHGVPRLQVQVLGSLGRVAMLGHHLVEDGPAACSLWQRGRCRASGHQRVWDSVTRPPPPMAVPRLTRHRSRSPLGPEAEARQALCRAASSGSGTQRPSPESW